MSHPRPLDNSRFDKNVSKALEYSLTCKFHKMSHRASTDKVRSRNSLSGQTFQKCQSIFSYSECIREMGNTCRRKSLRALKTVRSTMESIEILISHHVVDVRQLRVIHLMRDPRGQYSSKNKSVEFHTCRRIMNAFCQRMEKDLLLLRQLKNIYPNSFMELHYEDLALKPLKTAESIYQFVLNRKMSVPNEVMEWFQKNTNNPDLKFEKPSGSQRRNSTETAEAWKKKLSHQTISLIDEVCSKFYQTSMYYTAWKK